MSEMGIGLHIRKTDIHRPMEHLLENQAFHVPAIQPISYNSSGQGI